MILCTIETLFYDRLENEPYFHGLMGGLKIRGMDHCSIMELPFDNRLFDDSLEYNTTEFGPKV